MQTPESVSYTHLRAHETGRNLVCRLLLEKKKKKKEEGRKRLNNKGDKIQINYGYTYVAQAANEGMDVHTQV